MSLSEQKYPGNRFEIILADDHSTDHTLSVARKFTATRSKVRIVQNPVTPKYKSSKKASLQNAIALSKGSIVLLIDADCSAPPCWIKTIVSCYGEKTGLIAGFSPQVSDKGQMWNNFLTIDSMAAAVVAAGSIGWGQGITCTGRNLSFRVQALQDIGGYGSFPDSISGDDDFLLQRVSRHSSWHTNYAFSGDAIVPAQGPGNFFQFIRQKQRHLSSGKFYPSGYQAGYILFHLSNFTIWMLLFYSLYTLNFLYGIPWIIKLTLDLFILRAFSAKIHCRFPLSAFLPWEAGFFVYHCLAGPGALWGRIEWK